MLKRRLGFVKSIKVIFITKRFYSAKNIILHNLLFSCFVALCVVRGDIPLSLELK